MEIVKNWFTDEDNMEMLVSDDDYFHRIIKVNKKNKLPKIIEVGINLHYSNHFASPSIVHQDDLFDTYVLSYYKQGQLIFNDEDQKEYDYDMKEAHADAVKAGYQPVFGFEDVSTNEKDEVVVLNVSKFK